MDESLVVIGLLCSSFVAINRGTNRRFPFAPLGDERVAGVREGNCLTSRLLGTDRMGHGQGNLTFHIEYRTKNTKVVGVETYL